MGKTVQYFSLNSGFLLICTFEEDKMAYCWRNTKFLTRDQMLVAGL
jgi:hypothetical protein